jgi:hypothetical protein
LATPFSGNAKKVFSVCLSFYPLVWVFLLVALPANTRGSPPFVWLEHQNVHGAIRPVERSHLPPPVFDDDAANATPNFVAIQPTHGFGRLRSY